MSERTAVYRVYDASDALLYVGAASSFGRRWSQHSSARPWWPLVHRQTVIWYGTRREALAAEAVAIRQERPRHNAVSGNLTRSAGTTPNRPIRIEDELWTAFGVLVGARQRSAVIRDLIRWYLSETDEPPDRPPRRSPDG